MNSIVTYTDQFFKALGQTIITNENGSSIGYSQGVEQVISRFLLQIENRKQVFFIGNGGSAGIASHLAADFIRHTSMKAITFTDAALLTCLGNDLGYEHAFEKAISVFGEPGDVLVAISSSGKSKNIILAANMARKLGCGIITFTGFSSLNPLRKLGDINFHIPVKHYGLVETGHHFLLQGILDILMARKADKECEYNLDVFSEGGQEHKTNEMYMVRKK